MTTWDKHTTEQISLCFNVMVPTCRPYPKHNGFLLQDCGHKHLQLEEEWCPPTSQKSTIDPNVKVNLAFIIGIFRHWKHALRTDIRRGEGTKMENHLSIISLVYCKAWARASLCACPSVYALLAVGVVALMWMCVHACVHTCVRVHACVHVRRLVVWPCA